MRFPRVPAAFKLGNLGEVVDRGDHDDRERGAYRDHDYWGR